MVTPHTERQQCHREHLVACRHREETALSSLGFPEPPPALGTGLSHPHLYIDTDEIRWFLPQMAQVCPFLRAAAACGKRLTEARAVARQIAGGGGAECSLCPWMDSYGAGDEISGVTLSRLNAAFKYSWRLWEAWGVLLCSPCACTRSQGSICSHLLSEAGS